MPPEDSTTGEGGGGGGGGEGEGTGGGTPVANIRKGNNMSGKYIDTGCEIEQLTVTQRILPVINISHHGYTTVKHNKNKSIFTILSSYIQN